MVGAPSSIMNTPMAISTMPATIRQVSCSLKNTRAPIAVSATPLAAQIPYEIPTGIPLARATVSKENAVT